MTEPVFTLAQAAALLEIDHACCRAQYEYAALVRAAVEVVNEARLHSCSAHRTIAAATCDMCAALAAFDSISRGEQP